MHKYIKLLIVTSITFTPYSLMAENDVIKSIFEPQKGFHLRAFKPSARIYFDIGTDDPGEVDIFKDGNITASLELLELAFSWELNSGKYTEEAYLGFALGLGIGSSANDSEDGTTKASNSPIFTVSAGFFYEIVLGGQVSMLFEAGITTGFTTEEGLSDTNDTALYVGLSMNF